MGNDSEGRVVESRRINAPASVIFDLVRDPRMHPAFDGSGMVRANVTQEVVTAVGDVFAMKMFSTRLGEYTTYNHVVEFVVNRKLAWEPGSRDEAAAAETEGDDGRVGQRWTFELEPNGENATTVTEIYDCSRTPGELRAQIDNGNVWRDAMAASLARIDDLCQERLHR